MKKLNQVLFINEEDGRYYISFNRPLFQGGDAEEISEEDAVKIMHIINANKS